MALRIAQAVVSLPDNFLLDVRSHSFLGAIVLIADNFHDLPVFFQKGLVPVV